MPENDPPQLSEIAILLPCHSLEDFPTHSRGAEAEDLLALWCALWHPALVTTAGKMPTWHRADMPPESVAGWLLAVPQISRDLLAEAWLDWAREHAWGVLSGCFTAEQAVCAAVESLGDATPKLDPELARDFLALGYCYLQVELLTRRMRYISHVDRSQFQRLVVEAAQAAVANEDGLARTRLSRCFDMLGEARDHFYPVDVHLIDLALVAATTLGPEFTSNLGENRPPTSLLMPGEVVERLARTNPDGTRVLRERIASGRAAVIGGEYREDELPLHSLEEIHANLDRGRGEYEAHLETAPRVFARRRFGLSPILPQVLKRSGFTGAYHVTLDDGRFPKSDQARFRWEGIDGTAIDALAKIPLDANESGTFLELCVSLGESMDHDHVATLVLAHWPGSVSPFYEHLYRASRYSGVLGKFTVMDKYLESTDTFHGATRLAAHGYQSPYLSQDASVGRADPISRHVACLQENSTNETKDACDSLAALLRGSTRQEQDSSESPAHGFADVDASGKELAAALLGAGVSDAKGTLILNPLTFARRAGIEIPVRETLRLAEVPSMGFAWIGDGQDSLIRPRQETALARDTVLRNQHLEVVIHPEHGGIQAVRIPGVRGNRVSQQIAIRCPGPLAKPGEVWRDPDESAAYSHMVCDRLEIADSSHLRGVIRTSGRLVDAEGLELARFEQRTALWWGSRVISVEIDLDLPEPPHGDPWSSYVCSRLAWADAGPDVRRSLGGCAVSSEGPRLEAPEFIEIDSGNERLTLLTGGLPYHRLVGHRQLDSLLIVSGETTRRFRLGIGIDLPIPARAAQEWSSPPMVLPDISSPVGGQISGWLFHIDAGNLVATHWEPLVEEQDAADGRTGRVVGFRVRLLETQGRSGRGILKCFRTPSRADRVDLVGKAVAGLVVVNDGIRFDFSPYEWAQIDAYW